MSDDLQLLRNYAAQGSEDAFRMVLERYVGLVYGSALRQVGNPHFAEEITQAVFLILARKAGSLPSGTLIGGWLFRTTQFVAARALRDEVRRQRREKEAAQMETVSSSSSGSGVRETRWEEIAPRLDDALAHLRESDRAAILLRFFQQKDLAELGCALGTSENTAAKRVSRALEKLRVFLARRGAVATGAALAALLTQNAAQAAPTGLAGSTLAAVTAKAGSTTTLLLAKAALKSMFYGKACAAGVASVALLAVIGAGTLLAQKEKDFALPTEVGKTFTIEIPGLPAGAKKLELVVVSGLGAVKPFLIGKYEVTQGQYAAVMHTNPSSYKKGPDFPVEMVTWQNAKDFCTQLQAVLPGELRGKINIRLPTDEEWSIAVGLPQETGRTPKDKSGKIKKVYPWGAQWPPPPNGGNYSETLGQTLLRTNLTTESRSGRQEII